MKLSYLQRGDRFKWNGHIYTVQNHEGTMVEVWGNGRYWAWPSQVIVKRV